MFLRSGSALIFLLVTQVLEGCTLFKFTENGRTLVGNHEDAWSINARIRFVNGENGEYGVVYFTHFNGSPLRRMGDQGGMNEAGLMFDGFMVPITDLRPQPGKPAADIHALISKAMRTCSTVVQVADVFRPYNLAALNGGMLFFCDRTGHYLVVEADTLVRGSDVTYALGNFRASQCTDLSAVPIERFQRGRRMLAAGPDTSLAYCTTLLDSMSVCRNKLGEGTLYSYLADLNSGVCDIFFYHDFSRHVTFDLKEELMKGDHEFDIASLFPAHAEYDRLLAYMTPMHHRWLFWLIVGIAAVMFISATISIVRVLFRAFMRLRRRTDRKSMLPDLLAIASAVIVLFLTAPLLLQEGVYYFGLGDALDPIHPALKYMPMLLCSMVIISVVQIHRTRRFLTPPSFSRWIHGVHVATLIGLVGLLFYWDLVLV